MQRLRRQRLVLRREIERSGTGIVRKGMLRIMSSLALPDEGDGVSAGSKSPIDRQPGQILGIVCPRLDSLRS